MMIQEYTETFEIADPGSKDLIADLCSKWVAEMGHCIDHDRIKEEIDLHLKKGRIFLARSEGKIVGILAVSIKRPIWNGHSVAHEECVFVDPSYRGSGILLKFVKLFEEWAKNMGCTEVVFNPSIYGAPKIQSFCKYLERMGYEVTSYELTKGVQP